MILGGGGLGGNREKEKFGGPSMEKKKHFQEGEFSDIILVLIGWTYRIIKILVFTV